MIPLNKKITELTWGDIISDLDERYKSPKATNENHLNFSPSAGEFIDIKKCALITNYSTGYIRQLVFKRLIPFHKHPHRKPIRFKRSEILEWMSGKKFTPIDELAESYVTENRSYKK
jgi:hypothetical protein